MTQVTQHIILQSPTANDPLLDMNTQPSLDLQFATSKTLDDRVSGLPLVDHQRDVSSGKSAGTYVGSDGLIKTSPVNLLTYSNNIGPTKDGFFTSATTVTENADTAPDGTTTATRLSSDVGYAGVQATITSGVDYVFSFYVKTSTDTSIRLLTQATPTLSKDVTVVPGEWTRVDLAFTATSTGNQQLRFVSGNLTTGEILIWGAQLEEGTTPTTLIPTQGTISGAPRFDHDPATGESLGLLIEESRTNYYEASSDVATLAGVLVNGFTATSDAVTAPDGAQEADRIVETANASTHYVLGGQAISTTTGEIWTGSLFVKPIPGSASSRYPHLRISGGTATFGSSGVIFDLVTKQTYYAAGSNYTDAGVIDYPDGWKKIYVTAPALSTGAATYSLAFYSNQNTTNFTSGYNYTGDGVSGFYLWGAQLEAGDFPTSYIPTSGSTVTRAADVAEITGTNFSRWYNQSEGTFYGDFQWSTSTKNIVATALGTNFNGNNGLLRGYAGTDVTIPKVKQAVGLTNFSVGNTSNPTNQKSYLNGSAGGLGSNILDGPYPNRVTIGTQVPQYLNGTIKRLTYYPYRLGDTKLQEITS